MYLHMYIHMGCAAGSGQARCWCLPITSSLSEAFVSDREEKSWKCRRQSSRLLYSRLSPVMMFASCDNARAPLCCVRLPRTWQGRH